MIFTILVPSQTIMIPLYLHFKNFDLLGLLKLFTGNPVNLINTYWPFIISAVLGMGVKTGLYVYIFRQFFRGIPGRSRRRLMWTGRDTSLPSPA